MTAKLSSAHLPGAHLPGRVRGFQSMRKPYEKPTLTKLTREQAKLKLVSRASKGDQDAKDFLDTMFPDSVSTKKSA